MLAERQSSSKGYYYHPGPTSATHWLMVKFLLINFNTEGED